MARTDFVPGSASVYDFFKVMNERHRIFLKRQAGEPKPWTDDPVLRDYKFTNVFRELDKGTVVLREMEKPYLDHPDLVVFNTWWYRLFNWYKHADDIGFCTSYEQLHDNMMALYKAGKQIFTNAHMVRGVGGRPKVYPYLDLSKKIWDERHQLVEWYQETGALKRAFRINLEYFLIGNFTAYEIASDLRWNVILDPPDRLEWANPGNGAVRGLKRLGLWNGYTTVLRNAPEKKLKMELVGTAGPMLRLWQSAPLYLEPHLLEHYYPHEFDDDGQMTVEWKADVTWPPFELREIEHWLCEFDKYERTRLGEGSTRMKFNGKA